MRKSLKKVLQFNKKVYYNLFAKHKKNKKNKKKNKKKKEQTNESVVAEIKAE